MERLSSSIDTVRNEYDTVVIGSGYGGSVVAAHLASSGREVCILERGPERHSGEYPKNSAQVVYDTQLTTISGRYGRENALFDLRLGRDVNVLVGNGLGGTSLINAGVVLEPPQDREYLPYGTEGLGKCYEDVRAILDPKTLPSGMPEPLRIKAFSEAARADGRNPIRVPVAVRFEDGPNAVGIEQTACNMCGDCITGCNFDAKGTLIYNYLPKARSSGAQIVTGVRVRSVLPVDDPGGPAKWLVSYVPVGVGRDAGAPEMFIRASRVVIAAGVLGTNEILLRSRGLGLDLSDRLGCNFSSNGDALGFAYNGKTAVGAIAYGKAKDAKHVVGPTIMMMMEPLRPGDPVVEDAVVPSALGGGFTTALGLLSAAQRVRRRQPWPGWGSVIGNAFGGPYRGAPHRTLSMLAMGRDAAAGTFTLVDDRLDLTWIGASSERVFGEEQRTFEQVAHALGADYIADPFDSEFGDSRLITTHPLGGCAMGETAHDGVVDKLGRVYKGEAAMRRSGEPSYHRGLYVLDGSILPGPIGTNPLLTIAALAQRGAEHMLDD